MNMRLFLIGFIFLINLPATAIAEAPLLIEDAWILAAPPNARVIAGYMIIENTSDEEKVLRMVTSPRFERIEIHKTVKDGDIMRMVYQRELIIPAGLTVRLEPLGYHLMLINPDTVPKEGESVRLMLGFNEGSTEEVIAIVRKANYYKRHK